MTPEEFQKFSEMYNVFGMDFFANWECVEILPPGLEHMIQWDEINLRHDLPESFVLKYWKELSFANGEISIPNIRYSEEFATLFMATQYSNRFSYIFKSCNLSEKFLKKFLSYILDRNPKTGKETVMFFLGLAVKHQILSEEFIKEYSGKSFSKLLQSMVAYQKVSEKTINKYKRKFNDIDWGMIFLRQELSQRFIQKNYNRVSGNILKQRLNYFEDNYSEEVKLYMELTFDATKKTLD